jgi:excisionase family DNA binding protein
MSDRESPKESSHHRPTLEDLRGRSTCSIDTAAAVLGIGRSTAYAAAREGSLPVIKVRNRLLVPTAKLLAMLGVEEQA